MYGFNLKYLLKSLYITRQRGPSLLDFDCGSGSGIMGVFALIKRSPIVHVFLAVIFVVSGLIVNALQATTMILWWAGNKDLYRTLNIRLAYLHWSLIPFLAEWWAGVKLKMYMRPEDLKKVANESGIVVLNHKYDIDWVIGWVAGDRFKILGNAKCVAKKSLSYVPLIGWAWRFCEYIFVKRDLEHDTKTIMKGLKNLEQFKHYYWMLVYCEGTRFTPEKLKSSIEFAEKRGLKPLKHHLLPRTKGFSMLTRGLRDSASAIYDSTIYVKDNKFPTLLQLLQGEPSEVEFMVIRVPLEDVPENDEESAKFCHEMYQRKDADFDYCTKHNEFPLTGDHVEDRLKGFVSVNRPRRTESLWIALSWAVLLLSPLLYYIWSLIVTAAWLKLTLITGALLATSYGFHKIMDQGSVSSSSSSYGVQKKAE